MVSVSLPSDALLQHLPSYLGFSYLGRGVSLHGCSSKAQSLLLTLDEGGWDRRGRLDKRRQLRRRTSAAERSYPTSEVRGGGWEELPHI